MTAEPIAPEKLEAAVAHYRSVLAGAPDNGDAWSNLGVVLRKLGRNEEALAAFARGEAACPGHADLAYNHGNALRAAGDPAAAVTRFRCALDLQPDHLGAALNLNLTLTALGRFDAAVAVCRDALDRHPMQPGLHANLGVSLWRQGKIEAAIACYGRALALQPDAAQTRYNLGLALETIGDHMAAVAMLREARNLAPENADFATGLGQSLLSTGAVEPALALFEAVLRRIPDHLDARLGIARARLLSGDLGAAWDDYAWHRRRGLNPSPDLRSPAWDGGALEGRTLLVQAEQGMGDTIQFARYATQLAARGARVLLRCPKPLLGMMATIDGVAAVADQALPPPAHDLHVLMMDLPARFETTLATIPGRTPYLTPSPARKAGKPGAVLRVGITWAGSPNHQRDRQRSCALADFAPVFAVPGLDIVSLQAAPGRAQLGESPFGPLVRDAAGRIRTFDDTAALLTELDLVITVDTALAHLAGALGRPVWTVLSFAPDWRWLLGRSDTPWYPTMRLYRQAAPRDWSGVFGTIAADLARAARRHAGAAP